MCKTGDQRATFPGRGVERMGTVVTVRLHLVHVVYGGTVLVGGASFFRREELLGGGSRGVG